MISLRCFSVFLLATLLAGCAGRTRGAATAGQAAAPVATAIPTTVFASSVPLMPQAVTSFGAAELEGAVYAFGGYHGVPHAYNRDGQSGELWRLDPDRQAFTLVATSEPIQGAALVHASANGRPSLIRLGGMRARNALGEPEDIASLDEVAAFAADAQAWTALAPLPAPRSSHAAAVVGDMVYVVGGWKLAGGSDTGVFADSMLAFEPATQRYRPLPQPFARRALAAAALDGKLVTLGGIAPDGKLSREVHVYDPTTSAWSRAADLPVDGFGIAAASNGDVLYASARDGALYALDDVAAGWRPATNLAFPRFFHQLVMLGHDRLLVLGGISGMHIGPRIRQVEAVELGRAAPRVLSFVLSNPLRGRNRQGVFAYDDALYVFGGNRSLGQHDFAPEDFVADAGRLDLAALAWAPMPPFPVARQTVQTLVEDASALALGGFGHDPTKVDVPRTATPPSANNVATPSAGEAHAHADAFRYDLERDAWSSDASVLPTPRTQFGLVAAAGARWVFGGLDFKPSAEGEAQFEHPTAVLRAAPNEPFRPSGVELPHPRRAFAGTVLDGRYYMIGGMAGGFAPLSTCDVFEFASSKWSEIPCPKTRISAQLVALGGKLYLAGGSSPGAGDLVPNPSLEVFDPKTQTWSTVVETLPIEPRHLTMLPYEHALLLYSAHNEEGRAHVVLVTP